MTAKILQFPRSSIKYVRDPAILEADRRRAQIMTRETAIDAVTATVIQQLAIRGFPIKNQYDIGLLIEVLRSVIMRAVGEPHPLQVMADDVVVVTNSHGQRVSSDGTIYVEDAANAAPPQGNTAA